MRIGIAADHGGYDLKKQLIALLQDSENVLVDFGASQMDPEDDYPQFVIPLARAVARGEVTRGIAICGSGVGACIAANKVGGVRAALIMDNFSAHQGVEDNDMNILYVEALSGPQTVNTLPRETLDAYKDHGAPASRLEQGLKETEKTLGELSRLDIGIDEITRQLEEEGIEKFNKP